MAFNAAAAAAALKVVLYGVLRCPLRVKGYRAEVLEGCAGFVVGAGAIGGGVPPRKGIVCDGTAGCPERILVAAVGAGLA